MISVIEKILLVIIRVACGLVFVVPLIITTSTFFPFIFGKILFFELLVEVAAAAWVILLVLNPAFRPRRHIVTLSLGLYVGVLALTAATGVDPFRSFWSTQERMTGVVAYVHFYLWYLMLTTCFRSRGQWRALLWTSIGTLIAMAAMVIGQQNGVAFFGIPIGQGRAIGTLGNPIYIGVYGLISAYIVFVLAFLAKTRVQKYVALSALVPCGLLIIASGSRMVMLATLLSALGAGGVALWKWCPKNKKIFAALAFTAVAFSIFGWYAWLHTHTGKTWSERHLPEVLQRSLGADLVDTNRLELWRVGLQGFLERPFLGWGLENFNAVYYKYAFPERNGARIQDAFFDRSHNQIVDILAVSGIVGALAFVFVWFSFFWAARSRQGLPTVKKTLFLALASYLFIHLTVFDTPSSLILFFGIASFLTFASSTGEETLVLQKREPISRGTLAFISAGTVALLVGTAGLVIVLPWQASTQAIRALTGIGEGNAGSALEFYRSALERRTPASAEIRRSLGQSAIEIASRPNDPERVIRWLTYAYAEAERNTDEEPNEIRNHLLAAQLGEVLSPSDPSYLDRAYKLIQRSLAIAPTRLEVIIEYAKLSAMKGDFTTARERLAYARILDPSSQVVQSFSELLEKNDPSRKRATKKNGDSTR